MSELPSLAEVIEAAIGERCAQGEGGFPVAFVVAVEMVNSDGQTQMLVSTPPEQPTYRSMGLAAYAGAWFVDDAQKVWANWGSGDNDSDEG
jgi:hypothetical protein